MAVVVTPEQWQRIESLYHAAQAQNPEDRDAFLDRECAGDAALRAEVASLLENAPETDLVPVGPTEAGPRLQEGSLLGPYRIEKRLGAGGMGEVFRGVDTRLNRPVAIKQCRAVVSLRFRREALALSALNHPHICTLYDAGADFIVMELVEGETLEARLKRGPLPPAESTSLAHRSLTHCRPHTSRASRSEPGQRDGDSKRSKGPRLRSRSHGGGGAYAGVARHGYAGIHGSRTAPGQKRRRADRYLRPRPAAA